MSIYLRPVFSRDRHSVRYARKWVKGQSSIKFQLKGSVAALMIVPLVAD